MNRSTVANACCLNMWAGTSSHSGALGAGKAAYVSAEQRETPGQLTIGSVEEIRYGQVHRCHSLTGSG
jgi:hypothetical protein